MENGKWKMENNTLHFALSILHFALSSVAIFLFFASLAFSQNKTIVRLAPETMIENDRIELGKIAKISGEAAKIDKLNSVSLGYAPSVGMLRELTKDRINLAIAAAGFSAGDYTLDAPAKIIVRRAAQSVGETMMREAVEKAVAEQLKAEGVSFKIVRLDLPAQIEIPSGEIEVKADLGNSRNLFAPFSISLEIQADKKTVRRLSLMTQIEAFANVLVASKDLSLGSKMSASDVIIENRRLEKPLTNYLRTPENLRGVNLTKNISTGTLLTTDTVVSAAVIKTGDLVQIQAQSGNLKIIVGGEARTNGKIGDRISVKNTQSGAILQAVVLDEKTVKVNF